jgi:hypothetical protein
LAKRDLWHGWRILLGLVVGSTGVVAARNIDRLPGESGQLGMAFRNRFCLLRATYFAVER